MTKDGIFAIVSGLQLLTKLSKFLTPGAIKTLERVAAETEFTEIDDRFVQLVKQIAITISLMDEK